MSRRSSLGVTVLALVAFHSLSPIGLIASERAAITTKVLYRLIDPDEHLDAREVPSTLEKALEAGQIRAEEKIWPSIPVTIGELIELWQPDATKCSDKFFRREQDWLESSRGPLSSYITAARSKRLDFCFSHLDKQIEEEFESAPLSKSTREHFESFVEKDRLFRNNVYRLDQAIHKLRRLNDAAGNADQLDIGKGYMRTCEEVIERCSSIKRANYDTHPSLSSEYWPHVQFYDFCRPLVDFNFAHRIDSAVDGYSKVVEYFNDRQDQNQAQSMSGPNAETISIGTAKNDLEQERSLAAKAAVRYADDWAKGRRLEISRDEDGYIRTYELNPPSENSVLATRENGLDVLIRFCWRSLQRTEDFLWMYEHDLLGPKHGDIHKPTTERNLRFLKACEHLNKLENKEIIRRAGFSPPLATERRKPRKNLIAKLFSAAKPK
jgi:hypothetical protein